MESAGNAIYATPVQGTNRPAELYISRQPRFKYDFLFADANDFCEAEGWSGGTGAQEMTEDELTHVADDEFTIEVAF